MRGFAQSLSPVVPLPCSSRCPPYTPRRDDAQSTHASKTQCTAGAAMIVVFAIAAGWAAWPRHVPGWDATPGARAAALVVTNDDAHACQLQGRPELRIFPAGQSLEVNVKEYELSENNQENYFADTIAPGQSTQATLYWRGERSAYHDDSAQKVEVYVNEAWVAAEFRFSEHVPVMDSPFDLIHDEDLEIGQWRSHQ